MSSKLHRRGLESGDATIWEVPSKDGAPPPRNAREPAPGTPSAPQPDLEQENKARMQAAYQQGFSDGEAAGRQQATSQFQSALERITQTVAETAAVKSRLRHEAEEDVVKLAMAITRRILYRELTIDPAALLGLVRAALDKLDSREIQRVRSNPQDAPVLQQYFQQLPMPRKIEVFADPALARGSAVFETAQGALDASADTQLNEIDRGFTDLMKRAPQ